MENRGETVGTGEGRKPRGSSKNTGYRKRDSNRGGGDFCKWVNKGQKAKAEPRTKGVYSRCERGTGRERIGPIITEVRYGANRY